MVGEMEDNGQNFSDDTSRFLQLIAMFQIAAMQQMGKLPNPITNEVERDLQHAKASIDMLDTIKKKTEGNLVDAEIELLDKILFELHMNYVDEVNRAEKEPKEGAGAETGDGAEADDDTAGPTGAAGRETESASEEDEK